MRFVPRALRFGFITVFQGEYREESFGLRSLASWLYSSGSSSRPGERLFKSSLVPQQYQWPSYAFHSELFL